MEKYYLVNPICIWCKGNNNYLFSSLYFKKCNLDDELFSLELCNTCDKYLYNNSNIGILFKINCNGVIHIFSKINNLVILHYKDEDLKKMVSDSTYVINEKKEIIDQNTINNMKKNM